MSSQIVKNWELILNVTLSRRGDYVLRAAICLSRAYVDGTPKKIREISEFAVIPVSFTPQVLADLVRAGIAISRAGRSGGYWLSRPPSEISLLEVIEAGEGDIHSDRCAMGDGPCYWEKVCPLHDSWKGALSSFRDGLAASTLAEVTERDIAIESGEYLAPIDSHRGGRVVKL